MSPTWIVVGLLTWLLLACVTALVIGRVIRHRDRQIPREPGPDLTIPAQRGAPAEESRGANGRPPGAVTDRRR